MPGRGPGRPRTRPIKVPNPNRAKPGTKIGTKTREIIPKRDKAVRYIRDDGKERPHVCDVCGKRFTRDGGLVLHKRLHDPNFKRFECEKCDKSFVQKGQLEVHMKIHNKQYDYVCKICNKGTDRLQCPSYRGSTLESLVRFLVETYLTCYMARLTF